VTTDAAPPPAPRFVILDGHAIIFRAYFALRDAQPFSVKRTGEETTAVYGFVNTLLRIVRELQPTHLAVAMDTDTPTFRHDADSAYKAHRDPIPEALPHQIERCRQIVEAFGIPLYEADGWEADDVLATIADQAAEQGLETWIGTLDSDLLQLVRENIHVYMYRPYQRDTVIYDSPAKVRERYGIDPIQVIDYKGLKGDTSDNIPGVPGIGDKTAVKLLNEYRTIEEIYADLDAVTPPRAQNALRANEDLARHSKRMAAIRHDAPVALDVEAAALTDFDEAPVVELFTELEFRSLVERLGDWPAAGRRSAPDDTAPVEYEVVTTAERIGAWLERARAADLIAVGLETSGPDAMACDVAGYALAVASGAACYVPVRHAPPREADGQVSMLPADPGLTPDEARDLLRPLLEDDTVAKTLHDAKFALKVFANAGVSLRGVVRDTRIEAYLLGDSTTALPALAFERLGMKLAARAELVGTGRKQIAFTDLPAADAGPYAAARADAALRLAGALDPELEAEEQIAGLYRDLELPLVAVLAAMERRGVTLDPDAFAQLAGELDSEIAATVTAIYDAVGHEFNIGSPKQLSEVLFEELGLPKTRKTTQGFTTDAQALERIADAHPVIRLVLHYRELSKLKSTYVDTLPQLINPATGRIHTDYNQAVAATGRLSSENPNLQNIPVRTEQGRAIRAAFVARPAAGDPGAEVTFLGADYSQIELRVLAHLSQDPHLIEAFQNEEDIHAATASGVYGVAPEDVAPEMRRIAKMMNFGVIYGLSAHGLTQRSGMERRDAQAFIDAYFERFARVAEYIEEVKQSTRERGYAETLLGRRRYIPEIRSNNFQARSAAERVAVNMPVQGTAADVMKRAMLDVEHAIAERELAGRMLLQVHDELILEVPPAEVDEMAALLQARMPQAIAMVVPLKIEMKSGPNWRDMAPLAAP
jgi:DNA polymerase-1